MNVKISIRDAPVLINKKQLSQVQCKKKMSLYRKPQGSAASVQKSFKKVVQPQKINDSNQQKRMKEAEAKLMQDLSKISKKENQLDSIQSNNKLLSKHNQILETNQMAIHHLLKTQMQPQKDIDSSNKLKQVTQMVAKTVEEIKLIRNEIIDAGKEFNRQLRESKGKPEVVKIAGNVAEMNGNIKALAEASEQKLQGIRDIESLKGVQNFNVEAYSQAIGTLRKQIAQYQKDSDQIERELRLRAQKLQKLEHVPNFDDKLIEPYQQHLKKKIQAINLHTIREKLYDQIGEFNYHGMETELNSIMNQVKNQMSNFGVICKTYTITVPQRKIDSKQIKNLQFKQTSVLQEYKIARGIQFKKKQQQHPNSKQQKNKNNNNKEGERSIKSKTRTAAIQQRLHGKKMPKQIQDDRSKPTDLVNNVRLKKIDEQTKTILQNEKHLITKKTMKQVGKYKKTAEQDQFDKYLQNRKNQELQQLYRQKKIKLQTMQKQLYQECTNAIKIQYAPKYNQIKNSFEKEQNKRQYIKKKQKQNEQHQEQSAENVQNPAIKQQLKGGLRHEQMKIKTIGAEALKQRLKSLYDKKKPINQVSTENIAHDIVSLINNALTKVNSRIADSIEHKLQKRSKEMKGERMFSRIEVPKLEQIGLPPAFPLYSASINPFGTQPSRSIHPQNYDHLIIKDQDSYSEEEFQDLAASGFQP